MCLDGLDATLRIKDLFQDRNRQVFLQLRKRRQRPMLSHDDLGNRLSTLRSPTSLSNPYFTPVWLVDDSASAWLRNDRVGSNTLLGIAVGNTLQQIELGSRLDRNLKVRDTTDS